MLHLARLARLDYQTRRGTQTLADQVMMHGRGGQQRRNRHPALAHLAIRQHEYVVATENRFGRLGADSLDSRAEPVHALTRRPGGVDGVGAEGLTDQRGDGTDFRQVAVGKNRLRHFQAHMRAGMMTEQVRSRPDHGDQRHHQLLADRINRRIGDLSEILLEVVVEQLGLIREHRDGHVHAHRANRILATARHRLKEDADVLVRIAEALLGDQQIVDGVALSIALG